MADFDAVRSLGLALPEVVESTTYGAPAIKRGKTLIACMATNAQAEPDTLAVRVGFDARDELIAADPRVYYLKEHYQNYPVVLARLRRIHPDALRGLIELGWRFAAAKARRTTGRPAGRR